MVKSKLIGAASWSVLMSLGLVACGNSADTNSVEAEIQDEEVQSADITDETSAYADTAQTYTEELETAASDLESSGSEEASQSMADAAADASNMIDETGGDLLTETGERLDKAAATLAALKPMRVSDVRSKADIELVTESAFDMADFNRDGVLDRDEFANMTMVVVNRDGDALTGAVNNGAEKMLNNVTGAAGQEVVKPADEAVATAAIDDAFTQASGEDAEMTKEELRKTFLARFEQADVNDNDQLEEEERKAFALLSAGKIDQ